MHQSTGDRRPGNEANAILNWKRMLVGWKGSGLNKAYTVYIHLINVPFSWGCQVFFIIIIGRSCFFFPMFSGKICSFCFCCLICVCVCMSSDFGRSVGAGGYDINHAVVKDVFASLYERDFHHGKSWKKTTKTTSQSNMGVSFNGGTPVSPQVLIIFSRETNGCLVASF